MWRLGDCKVMEPKQYRQFTRLFFCSAKSSRTKLVLGETNLVSWPSPPLVFDCFQYANSGKRPGKSRHMQWCQLDRLRFSTVLVQWNGVGVSTNQPFSYSHEDNYSNKPKLLLQKLLRIIFDTLCATPRNSIAAQARRKQIWNGPAVLQSVCIMFWGTPTSPPPTCHPVSQL